jgi:predicted RNase H-like nuclease (RuvC/YqgF family)
MEQQIGEIKERLTRVGEQQKAHQAIFATQDGLRAAVEPLKESVIRTEMSVQSMARTNEQAMRQLTEAMQQQSQSIAALSAGHEALVVERNEREREEHQGKMAQQKAEISTLQAQLDVAQKAHTVPAWISRWWPVITALVAVAGFLSWLYTQGATHGTPAK